MPGWGQILIIVAVIVVLFGSSKLPQFARALRQSIDEFKKPSEAEKKLTPDKSSEIKELETKLEQLKKQ
jgi:sec-independent protein translocase protein TatA